MNREDKKKPEEPKDDGWKFSEQICYDVNLKGIKPDKMWKNRRANEKLKFKCEINFEEDELDDLAVQEECDGRCLSCDLHNTSACPDNN